MNTDKIYAEQLANEYAPKDTSKVVALRKLDAKADSGFFIGYCVGSRGSRFYCPSHSMRVIESDCAIFFEDDLDSGSHIPRPVILKEDHIIDSILPVSLPEVPIIPVKYYENDDIGATLANDQRHDDVVDEVSLRRSRRGCVYGSA